MSITLKGSKLNYLKILKALSWNNNLDQNNSYK